MPASADYLTKYLTASNTNGSANNDFEDSSRPKKRRKKDKRQANTESGALLIADDDEGLLLSSKQNRDDDDEDGPLIFEGRTKSAEFRKKKSSAWKTVSDQTDNASTPTRDEAGDEADRIIAAAAWESGRRLEEEQDEEAPAIVEDVAMQDAPADAGPKMTTGAKVGLQTAEDTALLLAAEKAREEEEDRAARKKKKSKQKDDVLAPEEETIYRDATGRRIDVSLRRQEARAAELAKIAAEKKEREAAMGDVQLRQKEQAKADLEEAKFMRFERTADDTELNEQQKEELRWDDPMAAYMVERAAEKEAEELAKNPRQRRKAKDDADAPAMVQKKVYMGAAAPNRYGIKPGWRWDGVDRGNGFEKEWFQARGKKQRNENLEYQWAMDE